MISNGLYKGALRHARHNAALLSDAASKGLPIVTTSSTCTFTMRDEYPGILKVDSSAYRDSLMLATGYIFEAVDSGRVTLVFKEGYRSRVAYHVPCHMEKLGWGDDLSSNAATMICSAVQFFLYFPVDKILFRKKKEEKEPETAKAE